MDGAIPWLLAALLGGGLACALYQSRRRSGRAAGPGTLAGQRLTECRRDLELLQDRLRAEQAVIDRLPDPLLIFGADRAAPRVNAAARAALGPGLPALLRHPGFRAALDRAQQADAAQEAELALPVPIARELHATVRRVTQDGPGPLLAVLSDRTRERAVERMRADFVANASHELRTPLASLIGFIETLRGPAADDREAQTRFLAIMAEQAQRMNRLIDDLLSLSRIELSEHLPPAGRVEVAGLVRRAAAALAPVLTARRATLETTLTADLPELPGDADQLEQVLHNLLDNAVKYGREAGRIELAAERSARHGQGGVELRVRDDGVGIARDHIPRLTERFYRVDTHRSRAVGGTGLGLAIVKHIVNRHRGQLAIESEAGRSTTVRVWLPS